jgi:transposase
LPDWVKQCFGWILQTVLRPVERFCGLAETLDCRTDVRVDFKISTPLERLRAKSRIQQSHDPYRHDRRNAQIPATSKRILLKTYSKKDPVTLTAAERELLEDILNRGKHSVQKRKRKQALLLADEQMTDEAIAERAGMHRRGIENLRQRFVEEGFEASLEGKPRGHRPRSIQGEDEARLVALVCSAAPEGHNHWSLRLIRDTWVTLEGTDTKTVSMETIRQTLKKRP